MALPQGVWSLKDALARRDAHEKNQTDRQQRSKRKKVIEIRDDEVEMKPREVKKRKPPAEHRPAAQASVSLTNSVNSTVENADDTSVAKETERPTIVKTRKPPKKKCLESTIDKSIEDSVRQKTLPRETPVRKSPRIREKAITLSDSDDSGPDLLPVTICRQPLKTTENTVPPVTGKRRKVTKQSSTPRSENFSKPRSAHESGDLPMELKKITNSNVNTRSTPPTASSKRLLNNQPEKRSRKEPTLNDSKPEVVQIPDKLTVGKRKGNITSKVVKIKKSAAPKKSQGPKKAGIEAPLPVNSVIVNSTQKTKYTLEEVLGSGGFGYIYIVTVEGTKRKAVMKVEPQDNGPLFSEMHFYQRAGKSDQLQSWTKSNKLKYLGIPEMYGFGIHLYNKIKYRYLVMPLFEGDLLKKHEEHKKKFSIQTALILCIRMVEALQYMHEASYVHADIKSANILLRNGGKEVFLADFGLARKYVMEGVHKAYKEEPAKAHDGTKEFTSIDAHKGVPPSRRGDMQILGYCCINWLGGSLPWYSWDNCNNIRSEKIKYEKKSSNLLEFSLGLANLSSKPWKAIKNFLTNVFSLGYEDKPSYSTISSYLKSGLTTTDTGYMVWS
ncbi:serine/threonine-protein kinase VRK1-like [Bolinopsis microptera]|uniref:serine/threonine-protein kinase VRK1-like n=1 Tax=Bolinopsis microptera TaxID=2820187 RepID=UPI003079320B